MYRKHRFGLRGREREREKERKKERKREREKERRRKRANSISTEQFTINLISAPNERTIEKGREKSFTTTKEEKERKKGITGTEEIGEERGEIDEERDKKREMKC